MANDQSKIHGRLSDGDELGEETPLLLGTSPVAPTADPDVAPATIENDGDNSNDNVNGEVDKPLPKLQILVLCYARLVEPISFFGIFPFISQMVQENGSLEESDIGFYSGLIESLFSLTQMLVMILWGRLADKLGRKPVLVVSLFGVAVTMSGFGFAKSIGQMILFRCVAGIFAGSIVTIRTMMTELSTKKTQARAFSFFAFAGNMGLSLGPLIGGALADPARQYPRAFGNWELAKKYPYALPTIVTGAIGASAGVVCLLFVQETKPPAAARQPSQPSGPDAESASSSSSSVNAGTKPMTTMQLLQSPGVTSVLVVYTHVMLLAMAYTAIVPVFWYTSPSLGGFGLSPFFISLFMGMTGLSQAVWLLLVFPPLHSKIGTGGILRWCAIAYPFFFAITPPLNLLLRSGHHWAKITFWITALPINCIGVGVSMAFTAVQLALNDISPGPEVLGTLNAIALTLTTGVRAFSPALFTSLFAVGVKKQILWGYLIWVILIVLAAAWGIVVKLLPEKAAGNGQDSQSDGKSSAGQVNLHKSSNGEVARKDVDSNTLVENDRS